jgi:SET domain-containing protein
MGSQQSPRFEIRSSRVHGFGGFALRRIRRGTRIVEYLGERISVEEGNARYDDELSEHAHVLLFTVDEQTVIDGGVGGSDAKYFNHSCTPNCEAQIFGDRVFIVALRTIEPGEELTYDYHLDYDGEQDETTLRRYACLCGAGSCRGTMLEPQQQSK